MRSSLLALLLALVPTAFGCGDDIKFPEPDLPDPAINAVIPAEGFAGRSIRVQVSGDGTEFTDAASVAFGAGITVDAVELASPSDLFVDLTIATDAALGLRDVTVTDGDASLALTQSFEVQDSLIVLADAGLQQGGISFIRIINKDPANPFLGDISISGGAGLTFFVDGSTTSEIQATVLLDTDAVAGPLLVEDVLGGSIIASRGTLAVEPRTPIALQPGGKADFAGSGVLSTNTLLFSFTATSGIQFGAGFNNDFPDFPPALVWLVGGKWADARGFTDFSRVPTTANEEMFVVLFDPDFILGDSYDVIVDEEEAIPNVQNLLEVEPNNVLPQTAPGAQTLFTGVLATNADLDVIKVTATTGQIIRVLTTTGIFGSADTNIEVFLDSGTVVGSLDAADLSIAGPADDPFGVEPGDFLETDNLIAGTYFVVIGSAGSPANSGYEASIVVEDGNL
ncbi:MAG: hypothetical protein H0V17_12455 [Deltaproteobacteria bacterium]|nr:hypothetical protein [Deltaproteobacteria bacterium]